MVSAARRTRLAGQRLGQHGLASAGRPEQQHALGGLGQAAAAEQLGPLWRGNSKKQIVNIVTNIYTTAGVGEAAMAGQLRPLRCGNSIMFARVVVVRGAEPTWWVRAARSVDRAAAGVPCTKMEQSLHPTATITSI